MQAAIVDQTSLDKIKQLGPAGFRLILRARLTDHTKIMVDGMPPEWSKVYNRRGYIMGDPVFLWGLVNVGAMRWADIGIKDYRGVLKKAKAFGLNHGVVVSHQENGRHTALSVSRNDRPYSDAEIVACETLLNEISADQIALKQPAPDELTILRLMSFGQSLEQIATSEGIAISTVKNRLNRARTTLGAKTSVHAVSEAVRRQLI